MNDEKTTVAQQAGNLPNAEYRRFEGMREYEAVIDQLIPQTQRTIRIFDRTLSRAYNTLQRFEALQRFVRASRANRVTIVLHDAGTVERDCPRVIELLRLFSTAIKI